MPNCGVGYGGTSLVKWLLRVSSPGVYRLPAFLSTTLSDTPTPAHSRSPGECHPRPGSARLLSCGSPWQRCSLTRAICVPAQARPPCGPRGRRPQAWRGARRLNPSVPRLPPVTRANKKQRPGWRGQRAAPTTGCFTRTCRGWRGERLSEARSRPPRPPRPQRLPRSAFPRSGCGRPPPNPPA